MMRSVPEEHPLPDQASARLVYVHVCMAAGNDRERQEGERERQREMERESPKQNNLHT